MPEILEDQCVDERLTARLLGVKPGTLQKWRWEGKGPKWCRVGRLVRYRRSELERFLSDAERSSTSDTGRAA